MKIKISNFGPIGRYEIDLSKDLIITYGKNNMGKSYALSVVYLLLKNLRDIDYIHMEKEIPDMYKESFQTLEMQIREKKRCNITGEVIDIIHHIFNSILSERLTNSFKNTFGPLRELKNFKVKKNPLIQIHLQNNEIHIGVDDKILVKKIFFGKEIFGVFSTDETGYRIQGTQYIIFVNNGIDWIETLKLFIDDRIRFLLESITSQIDALYFLPASRSGLLMGFQSMLPLMAELSKIRTLLTRKIELPAMPEPIADYILHLAEIKGIPTHHQELSKIVTILEEKILAGEIGFDTDKGHLTYRPGGSSLVLDMNSVSSMVSQLSPFTAFLKYILRDRIVDSESPSKPVIFIEEPEAHLHPETQVLLVDIFIKIIDAGIKMIVTSHSNYIFNKINNLLLSRGIAPGRFAPIILKNTTEGSVSQSMDVDELGIEDENFIDTADALYEEREQIIDSLNKESDD